MKTGSPTSGHSNLWHPRLWAYAAVLGACVSSALAAQPAAPASVSPGSEENVVPVATACPTFSWGAKGADTLELRVYPLPETGATDEAEEERSNRKSLAPAIHTRLPGSVSSWTPGLGDCLEPGQRYGWAVRGQAGEGAGAWSRPRFFEVSRLPSAEELAAAMDVIRRYQEAGGIATSAGAPPIPAVTSGNDRKRPTDPKSTETTSPSPEPGATLAAAIAAIRGEMSDTSGETVGLVGVSNSPDGAGLLAANTDAVGVDLVLDGSAQGTGDTEVTESSILVGGTTFDIGNAGNNLNLTLDGVSIVTTATDQGANYSAGNQLDLDGTTFNVVETGLDADTVDGLEASELAVAGHDHLGELWVADGLTGLHVKNFIPSGKAIVGEAGPNGTGYGLHGKSASSFGAAIYGLNSHSQAGRGVWGEGNEAGVYGLSNSLTGNGVFGEATAVSTGTGVRGTSHAFQGIGVYGEATTTATTVSHGVFGKSSSSLGRGVYGLASSATGATSGVLGESGSDSGQGVFGSATATTGTTYGVHGASDSTSGRGVYGVGNATTGSNFGVYGRSHSTSGHGVYGTAEASTGTTSGVYGFSASTSGRGIFGSVLASTGLNYGVYGESASDTGVGVQGSATSLTGASFGLRGDAASVDGRGAIGVASATSGVTSGVWGRSSSPDGYGGFFSNISTSGNGVGLYGLGRSGSQPDIVLGGNDSSGLGDDGRISSDPAYASSDIFLESNDAVVIRLDRDANESGHFEIRDGTDTALITVDEAGVMTMTPTDSPGTCAAGGEGKFYFDASQNQMCYCSGLAGWRVMSDPLTLCT